MNIYLEQVRALSPLIHNITNYVTANDVANVLLACGARPVMSEEPEEVEEITALCSGLNINLGTLNQAKFSGMLLAGKTANRLHHPIVLDPVGVGASRFRTDAAFTLLREVSFSVIRGNISEIKTLILGNGTTRGVDADLSDSVTEENLSQSIQLVKNFSAETGSIIAVTGAIDLVSDSSRCYVIRNGRPEMNKVTGTGCQLSGMTAAFLAAAPDHPLEAAAAAVCTMGLSGEIAWSCMEAYEGNASYRTRIIDAIYHLTGERLQKGANYEIY